MLQVATIRIQCDPFFVSESEGRRYSAITAIQYKDRLSFDANSTYAELYVLTQT